VRVKTIHIPLARTRSLQVPFESTMTPELTTVLSEDEPFVRAMSYDADAAHAEVRSRMCVCACLGAMALDAARDAWGAHASHFHARPGG
jgi:hypothetical protein